jgi:hypothetical protein
MSDYLGANQRTRKRHTVLKTHTTRIKTSKAFRKAQIIRTHTDLSITPEHSKHKSTKDLSNFSTRLKIPEHTSESQLLRKTQSTRTHKDLSITPEHSKHKNTKDLSNFSTRLKIPEHTSESQLLRKTPEHTRTSKFLFIW